MPQTGRDLGNLVRERGPHDESEKDLGCYRRPFPTGANLEQTWEGQSTALYFAKADAQREVMTVLQVLGQETQAGVRALLGALTHWEGISFWHSVTIFMGIWTWRVVEGHLWFSQMSTPGI